MHQYGASHRNGSGNYSGKNHNNNNNNSHGGHAGPSNSGHQGRQAGGDGPEKAK